VVRKEKRNTKSGKFNLNNDKRKKGLVQKKPVWGMKIYCTFEEKRRLYREGKKKKQVDIWKAMIPSDFWRTGKETKGAHVTGPKTDKHWVPPDDKKCSRLLE